MRHYCTYFDHNYLPRGLALIESLCAHHAEFELWVLCLSRECHAILSEMALPGVRLIALDEFEQADPALLEAKRNRSLVEYFFTCTPSLVRYVFQHNPNADVITYLDSDLYFFQSPEPVFTELGKGTIGIIAHRYAKALQHLEVTGIYNVGWVSFRRHPEALACIEWWRERCLEWCYDRAEDGRYGDQKYLDQWPKLFPGTVVLQHKGANLAPWNLANYQITVQDGRVFVDEQELIFFHYHGFKQLSNRVFDPHIRHFKAWPSRIIVRHIFMPYWQALCRAAEKAGLARKGHWLSEGIRSGPSAAPVSLWRQTWKRWRRNFSLFRGVLRRRYFVAWSAQDAAGLTPGRANISPANR